MKLKQKKLKLKFLIWLALPTMEKLNKKFFKYTFELILTQLKRS